MNTPATILAECRERGVHLTACDGNLIFDAPAGTMTPALRSLLSEHKDDVRHELIAQEIDRQLDELVPWVDSRGKRCWIHRKILLG
jgi:hypothetical protein